MNAILLGSRSDIGLELAKRLRRDSWTVWAWDRGMPVQMLPSWNLIICAIGTLKPIGPFFHQRWEDWRHGFDSNVIEPLRLIHSLYPNREKDASICFFGGTNPYKANPNYSAYASAKAALRMSVRDIGAEYPDLRVFLLDTGYVKTKIHKQTLESGVKNERLERGDDGTSHDMVYAGLKACLKTPIDHVRGKFFFVPDIVQ